MTTSRQPRQPHRAQHHRPQTASGPRQPRSIPQPRRRKPHSHCHSQRNKRIAKGFWADCGIGREAVVMTTSRPPLQPHRAKHQQLQTANGRRRQRSTALAGRRERLCHRDNPLRREVDGAIISSWRQYAARARRTQHGSASRPNTLACLPDGSRFSNEQKLVRSAPFTASRLAPSRTRRNRRGFATH